MYRALVLSFYRSVSEVHNSASEQPQQFQLKSLCHRTRKFREHVFTPRPLILARLIEIHSSPLFHRAGRLLPQRNRGQWHCLRQLNDGAVHHLKGRNL